jgi:phenylalanyl-tRNA synthetase alpha chain
MVFEEVSEVFNRMGFETISARLVNNDFSVFTTLNFPENHPARDIMDTFYLKDGSIPIPHTSSMQNWILTNRKPPIAAVIPGRCFRNEKLDPTHEHSFYQLEGIYVNQKVRMSDLIGTLLTAANHISEKYELKLEFKILPTYFPFVEPGIEIHARRPDSDQWVELIPAGMIHPKVLEYGKIDPKTYNGFAWAIGIDRLAMFIYGIDDIRWFQSGDLRFVNQF